MRASLAAAALSLVACGRSSERLACPPDHTLQVAGTVEACVDSAGRYDGPARGWEMRDGQRIDVTGHYTTEAPSGRWVCRRAGGERLELELDPAAFARRLWGIDLRTIPPLGQKHLGPIATNMCPRGEWKAIASGAARLYPELDERSSVDFVKVIGYESP